MLTSIINPLDHHSEIITNNEVSGAQVTYWGWGGEMMASVRYKGKQPLMFTGLIPQG